MSSVRRETARCRCYGRCLLHDELGWRMGAKLVACCVRMNLRGCFFPRCELCLYGQRRVRTPDAATRRTLSNVRVRLADEMVFFLSPRRLSKGTASRRVQGCGVVFMFFYNNNFNVVCWRVCG